MQRKLVLIGTVALMLALSVFVPAAYADCGPAGTIGDDLITCAGDDADGIDTGTGNDTVEIISGTVLDTIFSQGGSLLIIVNGGALDTSAQGINGHGVFVANGGTVEFQGEISAGDSAIRVDDSVAVPIGNAVVSTGNLNGISGIYITHHGTVTSTGDIQAADVGIFVGRDGSITSVGNIDSQALGLHVHGDGTIDSAGSIIVNYDDYGYGSVYGGIAILLGGEGTINNSASITVTNVNPSVYYGGGYGLMLLNGGEVNTTGSEINNTGSITSDSYAIYVEGNADVHNEGTLVSGNGIWISGSGNVTNTGNLTLSPFPNSGWFPGTGIYIFGNGTITNSGNITGSVMALGISGNGTITNTGNISSDFGYGIFMRGNGTITTTGNISAPVGIQLQGDGSVSLEGNITASMTGIEGSDGDQIVDIDGSVSAPIAVAVGAGDDTLNIRSFSTITGDVQMGAGDDVVGIGTYSTVNGMISGGETEEVNGDLLLIGVGQICSEDEEAVEAATESMDGLDPEAGTVTYLGQTYTWAEFEALGRDVFIAPCVGRINDGRINATNIGAPDALYCTVGQGVSVWELDLEGQGTFSFAVSQEEIAAAFEQAVNSSANQVIGADEFGNELYALSDGTTITFVSPELRETGKTYMYSFEKTTCEPA